MDQTEPERHHPGETDGEAALPPPGANHLNTHEQNRQGDGRIERRRRDAHHSDRRHGQRDAVGNREGRDRFEERPSIPDDQQQGQNEEQVIHTEQDVLDAQAQIGEGTGLLCITVGRSNQGLPLLRLDEGGFWSRRIQRRHAQQNLRPNRSQSIDAHEPSLQRCLTGKLSCINQGTTFQPRIKAAFSGAILGKARGQRQARATLQGQFPDHVVHVGRCFLEFEVAGHQLMTQHHTGPEKAEAKQQRPDSTDHGVNSGRRTE